MTDVRIVSVRVVDLRFPTSRDRIGSDAVKRTLTTPPHIAFSLPIVSSRVTVLLLRLAVALNSV